MEGIGGNLPLHFVGVRGGKMPPIRDLYGLLASCPGVGTRNAEVCRPGQTDRGAWGVFLRERGLDPLRKIVPMIYKNGSIFDQLVPRDLTEIAKSPSNNVVIKRCRKCREKLERQVETLPDPKKTAGCERLQPAMT